MAHPFHSALGYRFSLHFLNLLRHGFRPAITNRTLLALSANGHQPPRAVVAPAVAARALHRNASRFPAVHCSSVRTHVYARYQIRQGRELTAIFSLPVKNGGRRGLSTDAAQALDYPPLITASYYSESLLQDQALDDKRLVEDLVPRIRRSLDRIRQVDGDVSVSAYDTAWVARIPHEKMAGQPQFPGTLDWIVANQSIDGSWGDRQKYWLYDRFSQTLACVIALKSWNFALPSIQRGLNYIRIHANELEDEEIASMSIGFELSFPSMLAEANDLGLDLPYDTPFFKELEQLRNKKLQRVPLELLHSQPTTMLHTLEGLQSLAIDWQKVLKFQSEDGSICCSPSSTAVLYMQTRSPKALSFLQDVIKKFDGAVPTVYPLDIFHNLWVVDTLDRLGIARHFEEEIEEIMAEVYRNWSDEKGICWARVLVDVPDLDDTSMAFRLLRKFGCIVSAEGFQAFQKGTSFSCFAVGQMVQGLSDVFNLYRASQTAYPGESRLEVAEKFCEGFLLDALNKEKGNADKWSLKKDLAGEIKYALNHPDHKTLQRMAVRDYLDRYGVEDCWIGKTLYRLRLVNNEDYLQLAKADFNVCQKKHQTELRILLSWISDCGSEIADISDVRERMVILFAMFVSELWEPEFGFVRIAAGKYLFIAMAMYELFVQHPSVEDLRLLVEAVRRYDPSLIKDQPKKFRTCFQVLFNTINEPIPNAAGQRYHDPTRQLVHVWEGLLSSFLNEAEWSATNTKSNSVEYRKIASTTHGLEAIALSSILASGLISSSDFVLWMEKDSTFLKTASDAIRLAQRISIKKYRAGFGRPTIVESQDTAEKAKTEAWGSITKKDLFKQLNFQCAQKETVPSVVKRILLTFTKVANFYYDGYESESHMELQRLLVDRVE